MKPVIVIMLIVGVLSLSIQSLRHSYLRWFQSQNSVLEKYDPSQGKIKSAKSLDELENEYAKIKENVKKADEDIKNSGRKANRFEEEPFKTERELKTAIIGWEKRAEEIRKTRFFWCAGFMLSIIGAGLFIKYRWLGLAFLISGLSQMIWWVSTSFYYNEAAAEYNRMLENKFFLSLITLVFVLALWVFFNKFSASKKSKKSKKSKAGGK